MPRRVRKHANPFNCRAELDAIDRLALFGREAPLELELGAGHCEFLFARAKNNPDVDFVGVEVREPMVELAMSRKTVPNAVVLYGNGARDLQRLVAPGVVRMFHVHFPDPWPKKRHWKRRILQPPLVRTMAELLPRGGRIYAQSDVKTLAAEMSDFIAADGAFEPENTLTTDRVLEETTHWEKHHERNEEPIYRMLFVKVREPAGPVPDLALRPTGAL